MNMKKLVFIGAVALVVIGCVIAAGCTSTPTTQQTTSKDNAISLPVGEWISTNFNSSEGKTVTAIQTINADGTGYWMELNGSNPGFQIARAYTSNFSKPDQNGAFEKASSTGKTHKMVYDAAKGTITQDGKNVYTRLDPIVGIWSGIATAKDNYGNVTTVIKPDGTGLNYISYANGTAMVSKLAWKKNADGTYEVDYGRGNKRVETVDSTGKTLKTEDGRTKIKQNLMSVTGSWYNKDNDRFMVLNGDGTGVGLNKNGVTKFTWKPAIGKFTLTYLEGTIDDGTSLKGKTLEWTYDRDNDVFSSSTGTKYIRPLESIKGKLTLLA